MRLVYSLNCLKRSKNLIVGSEDIAFFSTILDFTVLWDFKPNNNYNCQKNINSGSRVENQGKGDDIKTACESLDSRVSC